MNPNNDATVLIVEDHPLFCDALSMTLQAATEIETVQTSG